MQARLRYFFPMYIFVVPHIKDNLKELCTATVAGPNACSWGLMSTPNETGMDLLCELLRVITQPYRKSPEDRYFAKTRCT